MQISQSRASSRGPLIAVIKIEIYDDQVDRIFLHQNDDDYKLAQEFQQKHGLNVQLVQHIYQRIKSSRESLKGDFLMKSPIQQQNTQKTNIFNNGSSSNNQMITPHMNQRQNTYRNVDQRLTPFDRINKYQIVKEQTQDQVFGQSYKQHINQQQYSQNNKNDSQSEYRKFTNIPPKKISEYNQNSSTFQTFMHNTNNQNKNSQLFERYLRQKQLQARQRPRQLIVKDPINNIYFDSHNTNSQLKLQQTRNQSFQNTKMAHNLQNMMNNERDSLFNQNKPERVRILLKSQMKSMQSSKKSLNKNQKQKIAKQVTNRLYNESDIKRNYLNKMKQRAKIQKQQIQDIQLTHRPTINKVSELIAADRYKNATIQDYLIEKARKSQLKVQAQRILKNQRQLQNCSFKPQVNIISKKLARDTSRSFLKDSHNKTLQQCSRNHSKSHQAFRPSLNKMSEMIVKSKNQGNFEARLKGFVQNKNIKLMQRIKQQKLKQKVDESGNELFRPQISKKATNRSPKGHQIHQYLYQLSKVQKQSVVQNRKPTINENSQQIIQQMYMKRIAWIFSELDSDQDGFISPKRINIETINEDILQVIVPVLFQMQEMNIQLNLQDFRNAIKNLHVSLNAHQKSILYNYNNKSTNSDKDNGKKC